MINNHKKKDISLFEVVRKIAPIVIKACPIYTVALTIIAIFHGLSIGFNTFMTQKFFDTITNGIGKSEHTKELLVKACVLGGAFIASEILNGVSNFMTNNISKIQIGYLGKVINEKSAKIDPINFENPQFLDDINKANEGMQNSVRLLIILSILFTFYLPYFIFMGTYLYKLKPMLAISLVLIFIPLALTQFIRVKVFAKLADESAPIRREYEYYERCIVDREYFKETRLLGAFGYFRDLYLSSLSLLNKKIWRAEKKSGLMELGMKIVTLLGYMGVLYLLVDALMKGDISVGAFEAVFASIDMMFSLMEEIICVHIGKLTKELGAIVNFVRFLDIPEREGEEYEITGVPEILIKDVTFNYPGADKSSISNLSLKVNSGETIAIVGENGAGKTSLVKIMTGLYLPTEGNVLIGRVDTAKISPKALYKGISGVFQKYQRYKMTLQENISISSTEEIESQNHEDVKEKLQMAICKADLEINEEKFPKGYETMLSREFDGIDLSGGQWQRLAIARGFYRAHNMIVLDEPTAAIDPVEESKIYKKFSEMSKGKTAIIVTHRLGSAKIADRIVVMDKGKMVEIGTHEELIKAEGKYSEMYEAQSKWYTSERELVEA
ncbi:ABC transporter ATP-binding protein [Hathewaya histolytica]|uniref:ABC transporter n=1 Tax=Hathewaya histolytica TaxID=1498 RepID=A0A4U9QZI3_HATHI|nr:ABC transporter ATP-binding protein [Hathewaya histolytica]VTQ84156.1 ABC transporter [Hathewaya histolytica]